LSDRTQADDARRGRTTYQGARGAQVTAHDGPLERIVGAPTSQAFTQLSTKLL